MSFVRPVARLHPPRVERSRLLTVLVMGACALTAAFAASRWPTAAIIGVVAAAAVVALVARLEWAVGLLVASFFFNDYINKGSGIVTPNKVIGGIAILAWVLAWAMGRRNSFPARQLWLIGGLVLSLGMSLTVAQDGTSALVVALRYVTFFVLFFLVLQTVQCDRRRADTLIDVAVAAAAIASIIGLANFLGHSAGRASGPISDPNDFGFLLASAVPLAIYSLRWAPTTARKILTSVALILIIGCILATFSRTALVGLAVAVVWALLTRRLRVRWLVSVLLVAIVLVGVAVAVKPTLITTSFNEKNHVASRNINVRYSYWKIALAEFEAYPLTGVGPGNFNSRFQQFAPSAGFAPSSTVPTSSISGEDAYLVVLAEMGIPGFVLFVGFLVFCWIDLRRRFPGEVRDDQRQAALAAGFLVAVTGCVFLTEQYFAPIWFIPAIAIGMATRVPSIPAGEEGSDRALPPSSVGAGREAP